ncbi:hypothetical protein J5893_04875 [bacterium]|nr:hypothetical protein [bacterium]
MNTINSSERRNHSERYHEAPVPIRYHEAPVPIKEVVDDVMNDLFDTLVLNTKNVADTLIKLVEQLDQKTEYTDLFMTELLGIRTLLEEINASKKDLISNEADLMYIVE